MTTLEIILSVFCIVNILIYLASRKLKAMKKDYNRVLEDQPIVATNIQWKILDDSGNEIGRTFKKLGIDETFSFHKNPLDSIPPIPNNEWSVTVSKWDRTKETPMSDVGIDVLIEARELYVDIEDYERAQEIQNEIDKRNEN